MEDEKCVKCPDCGGVMVEGPEIPDSAPNGNGWDAWVCEDCGKVVRSHWVGF
jgi:uncharacterized protein with PIN domain